MAGTIFFAVIAVALIMWATACLLKIDDPPEAWFSVLLYALGLMILVVSGTFCYELKAGHVGRPVDVIEEYHYYDVVHETFDGSGEVVVLRDREGLEVLTVRDEIVIPEGATVVQAVKPNGRWAFISKWEAPPIGGLKESGANSSK
jgi:hypothetical protein